MKNPTTPARLHCETINVSKLAINGKLHIYIATYLRFGGIVRV